MHPTPSWSCDPWHGDSCLMSWVWAYSVRAWLSRPISCATTTTVTKLPHQVLKKCTVDYSFLHDFPFLAWWYSMILLLGVVMRLQNSFRQTILTFIIIIILCLCWIARHHSLWYNHDSSYFVYANLSSLHDSSYILQRKYYSLILALFYFVHGSLLPHH